MTSQTMVTVSVGIIEAEHRRDAVPRSFADQTPRGQRRGVFRGGIRE
jgi:hypothetical protein